MTASKQNAQIEAAADSMRAEMLAFRIRENAEMLCATDSCEAMAGGNSCYCAACEREIYAEAE